MIDIIVGCSIGSAIVGVGGMRATRRRRSMGRHPAPTFLFADLAGYTALTEEQGDQAAARVAREFGRTMSALSREHGAWQVKSMGDGVMIWAPDAARAVALAARAVVEVGTRPDLLPVRVSVHTGPAVMRGSDWYGSCQCSCSPRGRGGAQRSARQLLGAFGRLRRADRLAPDSARARAARGRAPDRGLAADVTGVEGNRNVVPIAHERVCARGVEREHVRPIVRALPIPSAHASTEAWPAAGQAAGAKPVMAGTRARAALCRTGAEHKLSTSMLAISAPARLTGGAEDRSARFARLQERMAAVEAAIRAGRDRRSVVVVPYGKIDEWHELPAEVQAYEERLLCSLLELRDPNLRMTYVTSSPIAPTIVDYYLSLLTGRMRRLARSRLTLIALGDRTTRPLSEKLLERACVLDVIRRTIPQPRLCHLVPYNTTALERDLELALDIPIEGADPRHAHFGTKSGCPRAVRAGRDPAPARC